MKLTNKIILIFTSSIIIAISAMTAILLPEYFRIVEEASIVDASHQVNTLAQGVGAFFRERKREADTLSRSSEVQSMNFSIMRPKLMEFLSDNVENIEKVIIGDNKGRFYNTSGGNPYKSFLRTTDDKDPKASPKSIVKRDYWKTTVGSNSFNERRLYISEPMISYTTGVKQVVIASSIKREGIVKGLIGLSITWERVEKLIDKLKFKFLSLKEPKVFLISQTGTYWYHWDKSKVVGLLKKDNKLVKDEIGQTISKVTKIIDEENQELVFIGNKMIIEETGHAEYKAAGLNRYIFYRKVPGTTYSVGLDLEKESVLMALSKFRGDVIPIILFIYFIILLVLSFLAKTLITPFKEITEQANTLLNSDNIEYIDTAHKSDYLVNLLKESINTVIGKFKEKEISLKESEKRLSLAFEASRDGVWDWDLRSNNVKYSPRWFSMLGYEESELPQVLSTFETLIYEGDRERVSNLLDKYLSSEIDEYTTRIRFRCKDGSLKWILSRGRIIEESADGKPLRMLGTHVDIDEQVRYEEKIGELNKSLEKKVSERTSELVKTLKKVNDAKTEAEAANDAKSVFLANMSHEIRTPLNAIIGMTQILLGSDIQKDKKKELRTVLESGNLLLSLINDVLDLSKIESGSLELHKEVFSINTILDESAKIMAPNIRQKGIEFIVKNDLDLDYYVKGDSERIKQIILNFLGNSYKFTESGHIRLVLSRDTNQFKFVVEDTGVGINKSARGKVFKPFIQEDSSTTKKFGGTGLGLTICKKFVKMMGGHINFISEEGKGSSFWFEIPLEIVEEKKKTFDKAVHEKLSTKKVLIVDERRENREIIKRFLKQFDLDITTISNKSTFIEKVQNYSFDYVLYDIRSEDDDIKEVIKLANDLEKTKFLFLTYNISEQLKNEIESNEHILGLIQKPFLYDSLLSLVEILIEQKTLLVEADKVQSLPTFSDYTVLVVDDNLINLKVAKGILKKLGIDPAVSTSGEECLKRLEKEPFDIVFMDVHMPEMNGHDTTKEIRSNKRYNSPYIIALTALAMKNDRENCFEAGMNDYLSKPLKIKDLTEALEKYELSRK